MAARRSRLAPAAAIACTLAIVACASRGDGTIDTVFDPCQDLVLAPEGELTSAELQSIDDAAAMWNGVARSRLTRQDLAGAPRLPLRFEAAASTFHGVYDDEVGIVFINTALVDAHERAVTIAHEVGHAFGLLHVDSGDRLSVMNPGNLVVEPLSTDVTALEDLWDRCGGPSPWYTR